MPAGKQQLCGRDVLAQRPDVLIGRYRCLDLDRPLVDLMDDLDHDDRVELVGNRVAGVDPGRLTADLKPYRRGLRRADGVCGAHRRAVHRCRVVVRRGEQGGDGPRGHPAGGCLQVHGLGCGAFASADSVQRRVELGNRLVQRDVLQVVPSPGAWHISTP